KSLNLTDAGAAAARELDRLAYTSPAFSAFHNSARAFYLHAKMTISGLTFGVMSWNKDEGAGTAGTDYATSVNGTRWKPLHNDVYFNYNRRINNKMNFSVLANYMVHKLNNGTNI